MCTWCVCTLLTTTNMTTNTAAAAAYCVYVRMDVWVYGHVLLLLLLLLRRGERTIIRKYRHEAVRSHYARHVVAVCYMYVAFGVV